MASSPKICDQESTIHVTGAGIEFAGHNLAIQTEKMTMRPSHLPLIWGESQRIVPWTSLQVQTKTNINGSEEAKFEDFFAH
jgi:hypothetical protein